MRQLILIPLIVLLVACGQKGLLYIPDPSSADSSQDRNAEQPKPDKDSRERESSPDKDK